MLQAANIGYVVSSLGEARLYIVHKARMEALLTNTVYTKLVIEESKSRKCIA